MKTRSILFFGLILFLMIMVFTTCKKKDNDQENPAPSPDLTLNKTNLDVFEMAEVIISSGSFSQKKYVLKVNGSDISLNKLNDTALLFLAPKLQAGTYKMTGTIDNMNVSLDLTIKQATPPSNPKEYSSNVLALLKQNIDALMNEINQDTLNIQTNVGEVGQFYYSKYLTELDNYSAMEIEDLALLIQSNYDYFIGPKPADKQLVLTPEDEFRTLRNKYNSDFYKLKLCQADIILAMENLITVILLPPLILKWAYYFGYCYYEVNRLLELKTIKTNESMIFEKNLSESVFTNNTAKIIQLKSRYRNVNQNDVTGGNSATQQICSQTSELISDGSYANTNFLNAQQVNLPDEVSTVPQQLSNEFLPVHSDYISLKNISNSKVTLGSFVKDQYTMNVTFSKQDPADQLFNFDLVYSNSGFAASTYTVNAKLINSAGPVLSNPRLSTEYITGTSAGGCATGDTSIATFTIISFSFDYYCAANNIVMGIYFTNWDAITMGNCSYSNPIYLYGHWVTQFFGTWTCIQTGNNTNGTIKLFVATSINKAEAKELRGLIYNLKMKDANGNWSNDLKN
jgi:hypothetical protein